MPVIMPTALVRDIAVSAGAAELLLSRITELGGLDISIDTFSVALVPSGEVPTLLEFRAPDEGTPGETPDIYVIGMLVDASTVLTRGRHTMWVRVVDAVETSIFPASGTVELS